MHKALHCAFITLFVLLLLPFYLVQIFSTPCHQTLANLVIFQGDILILQSHKASNTIISLPSLLFSLSRQEIWRKQTRTESYQDFSKFYFNSISSQMQFFVLLSFPNNVFEVCHNSCLLKSIISPVWGTEHTILPHRASLGLPFRIQQVQDSNPVSSILQWKFWDISSKWTTVASSYILSTTLRTNHAIIRRYTSTNTDTDDIWS